METKKLLNGKMFWRNAKNEKNNGIMEMNRFYANRLNGRSKIHGINIEMK